MNDWKPRGYSDTGMRDVSGVPINSELYQMRQQPKRPVPAVKKPDTPTDPRELPHRLAVNSGRAGFTMAFPPTTGHRA